MFCMVFGVFECLTSCQMDDDSQQTSSQFLTSTPTLTPTLTPHVKEVAGAPPSHLLSSLLQSEVKNAAGLEKLKRVCLPNIIK